MRTPRPFVLSLALAPLALAAVPETADRAPQAPAIPPPILTSTPTARASAAPLPLAADAAGALYTIGDPSDDEQYYLELINRARANPTAEGIRLATTNDPGVLSAYSYFKVDLAMMQSEFAALTVRPPLAFNAQLTAAARGHTLDLFTNAFQGHVGTDGRSLGQRATDAGYNWTSLGENVYSWAESVWYGHAGFQVDWGPGTGGMQSPRGHRNNIHGSFREIGIGVINGTNTANGTTVGPQLVTQDFGTSSRYFVTGVAFHDLDGDDFYDPGEGLGGVTVEVEGASYHAVTTASGGYAVPIPSATTGRTVTFTAPGLSRTVSAACIAGQNTKVDLFSTYAPPSVAGPAAPTVGIPSTYAFTTMGGATGYEWQQFAKAPFAADPADSLARVEVVTSGTYSPLATDVKYSGTAAYHLVHPTPVPQTLTYPEELLVGPSASLAYRSRLGYATTSQTANVEISQDNGATWTALSSQAGSGGSGEQSFQARSVSLAAYAGKVVRLRFAYRFTTGGYYPGTDSGLGWYIDDITFTNLSSMAGATIATVAGGQDFDFTPSATGTYLLAVRPVSPGRVWPFGPFLEVTAVSAPPFVAWANGQEVAAGLPAGTIGAHPTDDFNGDGIANLAAYALGLSAIEPSNLPTGRVTNGTLALRYNHDIAHTDVTVTPQVSSDLVNWFGLGEPGAPAGFSEQTISNQGSVQTREISIPATSGSRLFFRLRITRP